MQIPDCYKIEIISCQFLTLGNRGNYSVEIRNNRIHPSKARTIQVECGSGRFLLWYAASSKNMKGISLKWCAPGIPAIVTFFKLSLHVNLFKIFSPVVTEEILINLGSKLEKPHYFVRAWIRDFKIRNNFLRSYDLRRLLVTTNSSITIVQLTLYIFLHHQAIFIPSISKKQ